MVLEIGSVAKRKGGFNGKIQVLLENEYLRNDDESLKRDLNIHEQRETEL